MGSGFAAHGRSTIVDQIAFEHSEEPHFDDVVSFFRPGFRVRDVPISAECAQLKFHVVGSGSVRLESFVEPTFLGSSTAKPLIRRLAEARRRRADGQFLFVTSWSVHPDDELSSMHRGEDGSLRSAPLFAAREASSLGVMRRRMREVGELDDAGLEDALSCIKIVPARSLSDIDALLNDKLRSVGLEPYEGSLSSPYDRLPYAWIRKGELRWDLPALERVLHDEFGWSPSSRPVASSAKRVGIRQFVRFVENMAERVDVLLDLMPYFNNRLPAVGESWNESILPRLSQFVREEVEGVRGEVELYTSTSIRLSIAIGASLHPKASVRLSIEQGGRGGVTMWSLVADDKARPRFEYVEHPMREDQHDIAVIVSVTHSILKDVQRAIDKHSIRASRIVEAALPAVGGSSVQDGAHCVALAEELAGKINSSITGEAVVHLFLAAPAAFAVALGRAMHRLPRIQTYEFEFERVKDPTYFPSLMLERNDDGA